MKQRNGGRGICFIHVGTRRNQKKRNGENKAVSFIQNMQSTGRCLAEVLYYFSMDEAILRECLRSGPNYEAVHIAGDIGCKVRHK